MSDGAGEGNRDPQRYFNQTQKNEIFRCTYGNCERCQNPLGDGWHAHHKLRWSDGGPTTVDNGMAVCLECHQKIEREYKKPVEQQHQDNVKLRDFQAEMVRKAINIRNDPNRENKLVAIPFCGSGKTLGALAVLNEMYRAGWIDGAIYLAPRLNLCRQVEFDWQKKWSVKYSDPRMGKITHRNNKSPILRDSAFGYVTTYSSLIQCVKDHVFALNGRRYAVVCDEAQQLGVSARGMRDLAATKAVETMVDGSEFFIIMTATELRADKRRLFRCDYSDPDENGKIHLTYDVRSSYRDGVAKGYLRPFDFKLIGGRYEWLSLSSGDTEERSTEELESGLHHILRDPGYWQGFVDATIDRIRESQSINPVYCGLIAAIDQKHARDIYRYIKKKHGNIKAMVAVSDDGDEAGKNLELFKKGGHDLLISVQMVYMGYDYPPISTLGCLTNRRHFGYLDQLFGRELRVYPSRPISEQIAFGIMPDDPPSVKYTERLRSDGRDGLREREETWPPPPPPPPPELGIVTRAEITGIKGMGERANGDLTKREMPIIERKMEEHNLLGSRTGLADLLRSKGVSVLDLDEDLQRAVEGSFPDMSEQDLEVTLKSAISDAINKNAGWLKQLPEFKGVDIRVCVIRERNHTNNVFEVANVNILDSKGLIEMLNYVQLERRQELKAMVEGIKQNA